MVLSITIPHYAIDSIIGSLIIEKLDSMNVYVFFEFFESSSCKITSVNFATNGKGSVVISFWHKLVRLVIPKRIDSIYG